MNISQFQCKSIFSGPRHQELREEIRRGSSCDVLGSNLFYHNRGRRQSIDLQGIVKKKNSIDNQLTVDTIANQLHIGI